MTSRAFAVAALLMAVATLSPPVAATTLVKAAPDQNRTTRKPAEVLQSYATVTHQADGTMTVTPASAELTALIEAAFEAGDI